MRATAAVLACFALVAAMLASSRWLAARRRSATGHALLAATSLTLAASLWHLAGSLADYEPFGAQQPIAELMMEQTGTQRFRATLTRLPGGRMQVLELAGREWRIEARTLEWQDGATYLGLRPLYQVERLATRDAQPAGAPEAVMAVFRLGAADAGDLWTRIHSGSRWSAFAEARRSDGPWSPLADGARFLVRLDAGEITVEPLNPPAAEAMRALH